MPNETPFGPLSSLVGRFFIHDGERIPYMVSQVTKERVVTRDGGTGGDRCYWQRDRFVAFLSGAKEVTP